MPVHIKNKITDTLNKKAKRRIEGGRIESYWSGKKSKGRYTFSNGGDTIYDLDQLLEDYNLKGFEFGNWMSQDDRAEAISAFITSIKNLSIIVGSKNLGFDALLGVAFGARGKTAALAHFESQYTMINLTKERGIGSFAHEWAHALDFILGRYVDRHDSNSWLSGPYFSTSATSPGNTGAQLRHHVNLIIDTVKATKSHSLLSEADDYWRRRIETFARAFEQYVAYKLASKKILDHYLAKPILYYQREKPYIAYQEFKPIIPLFDKLMREVAPLLDNKGKLTAMPYHTEKIKKVTTKPKKTKPTPKPKPKPIPKPKTPKPKIPKPIAASR